MKNAYREWIAQVDRMAAELSARYASHLVCRAGCSGCCGHHLSVFPVEGEAIREAVAALPAEVRARVRAQARAVEEREARGQEAGCPMLIEDRCAIYDARPVICRTQGLPLLLGIEEGEADVDFCPLNFTAPDAAEALEVEHLVPLEKLNLQLAVVNLAWCREQGIDPAAEPVRIRMSELAQEQRGEFSS